MPLLSSFHKGPHLHPNSSPRLPPSTALSPRTSSYERTSPARRRKPDAVRLSQKTPKQMFSTFPFDRNQRATWSQLSLGGMQLTSPQQHIRKSRSYILQQNHRQVLIVGAHRVIAPMLPRSTGCHRGTLYKTVTWIPAHCRYNDKRVSLLCNLLFPLLLFSN